MDFANNLQIPYERRRKMPEESRSLTKEMKKMPEYLPPEVITLILSRLPVESVVKCTAVCKSWYALIKHPSFISTHLQAAALQDDLLLLCYPDIDEGTVMRTVYDLRRDNDAIEEYKRFPLPSKPGIDGCYMVGTCNGLICVSALEKGAWNIALWNPSIHRHFILPEPDLPNPDLPGDSYHFSTIGFGFDSVSNDYKVLLVVPSDVDSVDLAEVWLFSLNRRSWTRLTDVSPKQCYAFAKAVFVKGALHFGHYLHMILAFDISTEKFFVINIPEALVQFAPQMSMIKYEESIALVNYGSFDIKRHELWVMKEYGVFHSIDENGELVFGTDVIEVFGVRKKGELFLNVRREQGHGCELATLDLNSHQQEHQKKQQQLKRIGGPDNLQYLLFGRYVESLVLLDKGEEDVVLEAV